MKKIITILIICFLTIGCDVDIEYQKDWQYLYKLAGKYTKLNAKRYANVIIPEGGLNAVAMDIVIARIESLLHKAE